MGTISGASGALPIKGTPKKIPGRTQDTSTRATASLVTETTPPRVYENGKDCETKCDCGSGETSLGGKKKLKKGIFALAEDFLKLNNDEKRGWIEENLSHLKGEENDLPRIMKLQLTAQGREVVAGVEKGRGIPCEEDIEGKELSKDEILKYNQMNDNLKEFINELNTLVKKQEGMAHLTFEAETLAEEVELKENMRGAQCIVKTLIGELPIEYAGESLTLLNVGSKSSQQVALENLNRNCEIKIKDFTGKSYPVGRSDPKTKDLDKKGMKDLPSLKDTVESCSKKGILIISGGAIHAFKTEDRKIETPDKDGKQNDYIKLDNIENMKTFIKESTGNEEEDEKISFAKNYMEALFEMLEDAGKGNVKIIVFSRGQKTEYSEVVSGTQKEAPITVDGNGNVRTNITAENREFRPSITPLDPNQDK